MDEQTPPTSPADTLPSATLPFEEPGRAFGSGLIETIKLFVLDPNDAYRRMPLNTEISRPLIYAILVGWVGAALAYLWALMLQASITGLLAPLDETGQILPMMMLGMTFGVFGLLLAPIGIAIRIFVYTAVVHLALMLVGGERNGFAATLRVVCYSNTTQLAQAIPFAGGLIATLWGLVLCVVGLTRAHEATPGKAVLAILLPVVLCCVCTGLFIVSAIMMWLSLGSW
jgi:hypothetical protein